MEVVWVPGKDRYSTVGRQGERREKKRKGKPGRKISNAYNTEFHWNAPSSVSQQHELFQLLTAASERQERSHEGSSNKGRFHFNKYSYNEH